MFHLLLTAWFCEGSKERCKCCCWRNIITYSFLVWFEVFNRLAPMHIFRLQSKTRKYHFLNNLEVTEQSTLTLKMKERHYRKCSLSVRDKLPKALRLEKIHAFWWQFEPFESEKFGYNSSLKAFYVFSLFFFLPFMMLLLRAGTLWQAYYITGSIWHVQADTSRWWCLESRQSLLDSFRKGSVRKGGCREEKEVRRGEETRLEKPTNFILSNSQPITTMSTEPDPSVPHLHGSWRHIGVTFKLMKLYM